MDFHPHGGDSSSDSSMSSRAPALGRQSFIDFCQDLRRNNPEATRLDLHSYDFQFTDTDAELLGASLRHNTHLQNLFLIINSISDFFRGILSIAHFVRHSISLQTLELVDIETGTCQARAHVADVFLEASLHSPSLSSISLFGVCYGARSLATLVRSSTTLSTLHHYSSKSADDLTNGATVHQLVQAFASSLSLQIFMTGEMDSRFSVPLLRQLQSHPTLAEFGTSLPDSASSSSLAAFMHSPPPHLNRLALLFARFSWSNVEPILASLRFSPCLRRLTIRDCEWPPEEEQEHLDRPFNRFGSLQQNFFTSVLSNTNLRRLEILHNSGLHSAPILAYHSLRKKCIAVLQDASLSEHVVDNDIYKGIWAPLLATCFEATGSGQETVGLSAAFFVFRSKPSLLESR